MSGIYGVISINRIDRNTYKGLEIWNDNYGDLDRQCFEYNNAFLGIKPEYLKDTNDMLRIFTENSKVGVIDALIFAGKNSKDTDELFLYKTVSSQGVNGVREINGDFAGALFDIEKNSLTLFRDHLGVRPLFYYVGEERVIFSTDIRGILSVKDVDAKLNEKWLMNRLSGGMYNTATSTEYEKIHCVPFGGWITFSFDGDEIKETQGHYYIPGSKKIHLRNREAYTKEMRRLIEDAVKIRAEATSLPLGAELSGGLDSGVISLLLAKMGKKCKYFSWTPGEDELPLAEKDERYIIKDICDKAGISCNHRDTKFKFDEEPLFKDKNPLEESCYENTFFAVKYAFPPYANTLPILETASFMKKNGIKLIFTGHGGDEGVSHRSNPYELWYNHEYYRYLRLMYSRSSIYKHRLFKTIQLIKDNMNSATSLKQAFTNEQYASGLVSQDFYKKMGDAYMPPLKFAYDPVDYVRNGGSRNRLDVVALYSSYTGVRYLVPFLDYRVLDFALGIPRYLYLNWYFNRYIFREAFKDLMPKSMYKQKLKAEQSFNNMPKGEDTQSEDIDREIIEARKDSLKLLDKDFWKQYLDYDLLDKWVNGQADPENDAKISMAVTFCSQAEHLVKRSREVNK